MSGAINPEIERIRAQAILRSFTDYQEAVELFAPTRTDDCADANNRHTRRSIMRVFQALKLNRRPVVEEPVQQPAYSSQPVTTSGCS
ncbi:MAG TPA: hypothetical protein VHP83_03890 [Aggregatilineaceae bacterium]|nr:hypothetical protein [Aggregatilineaceae bacterium]